jgi:signal transduction histidine kinase
VTDRLPLLSARRWIVAAMLLALHGALVSDEGGAFFRIWLLVHFGFFLLWQPFFSTRRVIAPLGAALLLCVVAVTIYFAADWMVIAWLLVLLGILGGRVFMHQTAARDRFYLVAFAYLLAMLLMWVVPHMLLEQAVPEHIAFLARVVLPALLAVLLALLPMRRERQDAGQVFDFFYAVLVFQLGVVMVLGSIALARTGEEYFTSVMLTALGFGAALFVLAVLWNPLRGFGGLRSYFSRYLLSVGMPFELWMRRIAELSETEQDARRFLDLAAAEIARFPWIVGGRWRSPDGEGEFGRAEGHVTRFSYHGLEMQFFTEMQLSPALFLHVRLLAQVVGEFYEGKRREGALRRNAYLQAVHETGARLTHDVKNLLQSLYTLISMAPRESGDGYAALLQRQLPQLAQRLHATLEKLRAPEVATTELQVPAREWWEGVERRLAQSGVRYAATIDVDRSLPAPLLDTFLDNGLENARAKSDREPGISIAIDFASTAEGVELCVRDTGSAVPQDIVRRLFHEPIEGSGGLGIGLYHVARQASAARYRAELAENRAGGVCFRLSLEG